MNQYDSRTAPKQQVWHDIKLTLQLQLKHFTTITPIGIIKKALLVG